MKTYCLTVVFDPSIFCSVYVRAKSLKEAIKNLNSCLPSSFTGDYTVSTFYTLISDGKKTLRTMSKFIRGVA